MALPDPSTYPKWTAFMQHRQFSRPNKTTLLQPSLSRRDNLKLLGLFPLLGGGLIAPIRPLVAAENLCTLAPQMTEGPYWVDEKLNRSDITTNTTRSSVLNATPLHLDISVYDNDGQSCGFNVASNVQVDIWHCDAAGEYSDSMGGGQSSTLGQTFLRGYQVSDADGNVSFRTIYPGWYRGRATHIHLRARVYDENNNLTYNYTSQLFFDDDFTDEIYNRSPYNSEGNRGTRNSNDGIFNGASQPLIVSSSLLNDDSVYGAVVFGLRNLPESALYRQFGATAANSGTTESPVITSELTVASSDVGSVGSIYVAATAGGNVYFHDGSAWKKVRNILKNGFPAFYTGTLSASHSLGILSGNTFSGMGRVNLYVGYGSDNLDLVESQRFRRVMSLY